MAPTTPGPNLNPSLPHRPSHAGTSFHHTSLFQSPHIPACSHPTPLHRLPLFLVLPFPISSPGFPHSPFGSQLRCQLPQEAFSDLQSRGQASFFSFPSTLFLPSPTTREPFEVGTVLPTVPSTASGT